MLCKTLAAIVASRRTFISVNRDYSGFVVSPDALQVKK
jgi:hypothetical protein